jgi:hypothetical protein
VAPISPSSGVEVTDDPMTAGQKPENNLPRFGQTTLPVALCYPVKSILVGEEKIKVGQLKQF